MNAGELCNRQVVIAHADLNVVEAARRMREEHVGDLVVVEPVTGPNGEIVGNEPVGIITDRDLVVEVLAGNIEWARSLEVSDVMTIELVTAREDEDPSSVLRKMRAHGVRRMPIVNEEGTLEGILTYDDLLEWLVEELGGLVAVVNSEQKEERARFVPR